MDEKLISLIVEEVLKQLQAAGVSVSGGEENRDACMDIASQACKAIPLLKDPRTRRLCGG